MGLDIRYHTLGYCTQMTPKRGEYMAYAPALDLTTLFEVILPPNPSFSHFHWPREASGYPNTHDSKRRSAHFEVCIMGNISLQKKKDPIQAACSLVSSLSFSSNMPSVTGAPFPSPPPCFSGARRASPPHPTQQTLPKMEFGEFCAHRAHSVHFTRQNWGIPG